MNAPAILERLAELGVAATLADGGMIALSPGGRTPLELRQAILANKAEVLALLEQRERTWSADPPAMPWQTKAAEDPRPDLPGSDLWARLLQLASGDAGDTHGVYGRLLACRACGGRLEWRGGRWKLSPTLDATERVSTWADEAAWEADAERWLRPRSREISQLLRQLDPPAGEQP